MPHANVYACRVFVCISLSAISSHFTLWKRLILISTSTKAHFWLHNKREYIYLKTILGKENKDIVNFYDLYMCKRVRGRVSIYNLTVKVCVLNMIFWIFDQMRIVQRLLLSNIIGRWTACTDSCDIILILAAAGPIAHRWPLPKNSACITVTTLKKRRTPLGGCHCIGSNDCSRPAAGRR